MNYSSQKLYEYLVVTLISFLLEAQFHYPKIAIFPVLLDVALKVPKYLA